MSERCEALEPVTCPRCFGDGVTPAWPSLGRQDQEPRPCRDCGGSGHVCPACGGFVTTTWTCEACDWTAPRTTTPLPDGVARALVDAAYGGWTAGGGDPLLYAFTGGDTSVTYPIAHSDGVRYLLDAAATAARFGQAFTDRLTNGA